MLRNRTIRKVSILVAMAASVGAAVTALGQTVSFTAVGDLGGGTSKCYGVSGDGAVVTGESLDGDSNTQAFIWTTSNGLRGIGFLNASHKESHGRGVGVDSGDVVHVGGYSKNSSDKPQAVHWSGDQLGVGSYTAIPFLPDGDESRGRALRIKPSNDEVYVVGEAEKAHGAQWHAFRWRSAGGTLDLQDIIDGNSGAYGLGWRPSGTNIIVGVSNSNWWISGSGNHREAFRWDPDWGMVGITGLDYVCDYGFQIVAGDNGIAETMADPTDLQLIDVGTTGLDREEVIVSAGIDADGESWLRTTHWSGGGLVGDDLSWPPGHDADGSSESLSRAVSPDGRFSVGRCTYPDETCGDPHPTFRLFQANFHDRALWGHTCYEVMHFPLGFLDDDNYSEALGVSNAHQPDPSRECIVVVGWSKHVGYRILAGSNGMADSTAECDDVQEVPVGTSGLSSDTVVVSPGPNGLLNSPVASGDTFESYGINGSQKRAFVCFIHDSYDLVGFDKDMWDLKVYLENKGLNLAGWELREANGVSDDGSVVVGWGLHNGVEEGFVVTIEPQALGACCVQTGWGSGTCTVTYEDNCTEGTWLGPWTTCDQCEFCPDPFADTDRDLDVDHEDFGVFQACVTGMGGGVPAGCECFDRDNNGAGDGDIDQDDWGAFEDCATGPAIRWSQ